MSLVPVILSGGAGTRLWPVSREAMPKPFLTLPDGETLLHKAALRASLLTGVSEILTVTNREYYFATKDCYEALGTALPRFSYLLEPFGRNTAPAVAMAALHVADEHPAAIDCPSGDHEYGTHRRSPLQSGVSLPLPSAALV